MERFYYISQPTLISFTSGQRIEYTYDADGNRLRAVYKTTPEPVFDPVTGELTEGTGGLVTELRRDYCHGRIYEDGERVYETFGEGFIDDTNTVHYYVHDYLGNVRAVVREDGAVVEENDYYPYGLLFADKANTKCFSYLN